jgi:hypothetical protein
MPQVKHLISELFTLVDEMHFGAKLYAIVDTGIYREFIDMVDIEDPKRRILFKDPFIDEYENVAPYLLLLNKDDPFTEDIITKGYGKPWLSFIVSRLDMPTLAFELRERINIYSDQHEREIIFRFYDPRNLQRYFKMLTDKELLTLFHDLNGLFAYVDTETPSKLHLYSAKESKLVILQKEEV